MKKLFLSLVVFSFLLVIGCQENSITDPSSNESLTKTQTMAARNQGSIPLEGVILYPGFGNQQYSIKGNIDYTLSLIQLDPIPPLPQYRQQVALNVHAIFTDLDGRKKGKVSASSNDNFYVSLDGIRILEKSFSIEGMDNGLLLVCKFVVTANSIKLDSRRLSFTSNRISKTGSEKDPHTLPPVINPYKHYKSTY